MTIHLPEDLERYLEMKIRSGRFASEDEAIGEAVRLLRQKEEAEPQAGGDASTIADTGGAAVPAWKRVLDIMGKVPGEVFDRMPADGSQQLDHYIYGTPKRPIS
jgi:Arc/MetJ-type ribon-helix-helix transcriptional regulator